MSKGVFLILLIAFLSFIYCLGQCPVAEFQVVSSGCVQQNIYIENTSVNGSSFEWDFCSGDLEFNPSATFIAAGTSFFRARSFRMIQDDNGQWFGFAVDEPNNLLVRFEFGASPDNTPLVAVVGNPASKLQSPMDIDFIQDGGQWYAFVANKNGNNLLRLNFGTNLTATPSVVDMGSLGILTSPTGLDVIKYQSGIYLFVTSRFPDQVVMIQFGTSVLNAPVISTYTVPGASDLRSISFIQECDKWFGLVSSYNTGALYYIYFNNGLDNPPVINQLNIPSAGYSFPAAVRLVNEGGNYFAFVQSAFPAHLYRINFGESIVDLTGTFENLGNLGISADNHAFDVVGFNSYWRGFSIDLSGTIPGSGRLFRISFPENCATTLRVFQDDSPPVVQYTTSGTYRIALKAKSATGGQDHYAANLIIHPSVAPDIDFVSVNECVTFPVHFTSLNTSGNITHYTWDFGDSQTSVLADPQHIYFSPGTYLVTLEVEATNGCHNEVRKMKRLFTKPVADFELPAASPVCTGQLYELNNTSVFDLGSNISWGWEINGSGVSTAQHLQTEFTAPGPHAIRLVAAIPGCFDEVTKNITTVIEGPAVNFSYSGNCQLDPVHFTNLTVGSVSAFHWDFGDGNTSDQPNPAHIFSSSGVFNVQLSATNAAGCLNSVSRTVTIYSRPQTDFSVALPPFSCSGTPTQFTDLTPNPSDSNIASWLWNFGDTGATSTVRNPQHTYMSAGTYPVSLTATTNFGCSATVQKDVQIFASPVVNFTHSSPCRSVPVQFNDVTPGGVQSRLWQIESAFYTTQNPVHTFSTSGTKSVTLTITGTNGCIGIKSQNITVPSVLVPDFMAERTCTNQQTVFTSLTNDTADPITTFNWNFGTAGTASGNPATATFTSTGSPSVSLTVITQTGCSYTRTKNVSISAAPVASFTVSADAGGAPLTVNFNNTSTGASAYLWQFGDAAGTTSTVTSPQFTYTEVGTYISELTAFNSLNCLSKVVRTIHVVIPVLDVRLSLLELLNSSGGVTPAVTIMNASNIPVANPVVDYDLSGMSVVREVLPVTIAPNASYRHVSPILLPVLPSSAYVCAAVIIPDTTPADNRFCAGLESTGFAVSPFPNPVSRQQQLTVSWAAASEGQAVVQLYNMAGQEVLSEKVSSVQGYNSVLLNTSRLNEGMYLLRVRVNNRAFSFRIQVIQ